MPAPYPKTGPVTLKVNLADSPLAAALKAGKISSPIVKFDFCGPKVAHDGFKAHVRDRAFDAGELAVVTFLQAKAFNKPLTLLPACVVGRFQHATVSYMHRGKERHPTEMEGQKVALRSYTQTTPTWARGILQHEHGVDLSKVTWMTTDEPHLAEYAEPANVVRVDKAEKSLDQRMIDGEVDFGILGLEAPKHQDARKLIPSPDDAALAWHAKYRCAQINHMFVIDSDLAQARPDVVTEIYRMLTESKAAAGLPKVGSIDALPFGFENVRRSLELVAQYAHEQHVIPNRLEPEQLFDSRTLALCR